MTTPKPPQAQLILSRPQDPEPRYQLMLRQLREGASPVIEADELLHLRVRLGLARGELAPEQVRFLFVEGGEELEIGVDALGDVSTWPRNLYAEASQLVTQLRIAQAKRDA